MKTDAQTILSRCNDARKRRWEHDRRREELEDYYNGGHVPTNGCREIDSLGLGNRYLRDSHKKLRSTIENPEGAIKVEVSGLDDFQRTTNVINAFEKAVKKRIPKLFRNLAAQVAGEFLICGRAFAWRYSERDLNFQFGRPLHAFGATPDIGNDQFWWWAFPWRLTLRDLDAIIAKHKDGKDSKKWDIESLKDLKRYLLEKASDKDDVAISKAQLDQPFSSDMADSPLDCYVYFEKSKEQNSEHRKVDMCIVSRCSEKCGVDTKIVTDEKTQQRKKRVSYSLKSEDPDKERVMYRKKDAFDSVFDCLIPWIEDARISGEQRLDDLEGDGEQFLPRLIAMEELTDSAITGTGFAMQPHFQAERDVDVKVARRLQETGLKKFQFAPKGVGVIDKSGVINSSRAGLELVQALGMSVEEESSTSNLPQTMGQRSNAQFAAEAEMMQSARQESVSLRFTFWHSGWDALFEAVGKTLANTKGWAKADPSYHSVTAFQEKFEEEGGSKSELAKGDFTFTSRRLPGGADKVTAMQGLMMLVNAPSAPVEYKQWAWSRLIKLSFGNEASEFFENPEAKDDMDQLKKAVHQTTAALTTMLPIPFERGDDPIVHLSRVHVPALQNQIGILSEQGQRTPMDTAKISALMQHIDADVQNLPGIEAREAAAQVLAQLMDQFAQIPEQMPIDEAQMQQAELQMKALKTQNEVANGESLRQSRGAQLQQKADSGAFQKMAQAKALGQQDARISIEAEKAKKERLRAKTPTPATV